MRQCLVDNDLCGAVGPSVQVDSLGEAIAQVRHMRVHRELSSSSTIIVERTGVYRNELDDYSEGDRCRGRKEHGRTLWPGSRNVSSTFNSSFSNRTRAIFDRYSLQESIRIPN